jgi:hypothetical protein
MQYFQFAVRGVLAGWSGHGGILKLLGKDSQNAVDVFSQRSRYGSPYR